MTVRKLRDLFDQYRVRKLRGKSANTVRLWKVTLRLFDRFLGRSATVDDFTDDTLSLFAIHRREKVAAATVNRDLVNLLALWRYAHRHGIVTRWPDVPLMPVPSRVPVAWMEEEFARIMAAARALDGRVGDVDACDWWSALLLTLYDTGERVGAVMSLTWDQVDLASRWVVFKAETRKGQTADNPVRIAEDTAAALGKIRRRESLVFSWPLHPCLLWRHYTGLLKDAGLPNDRVHKFHCIRRTTASYIEARGGDATAALGHSSRQVTKRYLDPRLVQKPQAVDLLRRPEGDKPQSRGAGA